LDGTVYNCTVTWNLFGKRPYLNVFSIDGTWLLTVALVGSPAALPLQAISWANGRATAITRAPHGFKVGRVLTLTVSGCVPVSYNAVGVRALITGPSTIAWDIAANPGMATVLGQVAYNINLAGALTDPSNGNILVSSSTLVFREPSQTFEVSTPDASQNVAAVGTTAAIGGIFTPGVSIVGGPDVVG
jgi:hypothetical protein